MNAAHSSQHLDGLPGLAMTLAEDETRKFQVSPAGQLSVFRGNRWSSSKTALDAQAVQALAHKLATQPGAARLGAWYLRVLPGSKGWTIFGERCPRLPDEAIDEAIEAELLARARAGSTGVIAGGLGSTKASVLLWLASLLGRRELVFVSELPPAEPLEPTWTHVYPPTDDRQRRSLERLLRAHDCIFWEGLSRADDFVTFAGAPGTHNRWFSIDADSPQAIERRLHALIAPLGSLELDSCIFIEVDAESGASIASLSRRSADGWTELLDDAPPVVETLEALALLEAPGAPMTTTGHRTGLSETSLGKSGPSKSDPSESGLSESSASDLDGDSVPRADEAPSQAAVITPRRAGRFSSSKSSTSKEPVGEAQPGADSPPDEPTVDSQVEPLVDEDSDPTLGAGVRPPRDLAGMSLDELLKSDEIEREELLRHSGEIDFQAMLRARRQRRREQREADGAVSGKHPAEEQSAHGRPAGESSADEPSVPGLEDSPEIGLQYDSDQASTNVADGAKVDAILADMSQDGERGISSLFEDIDPDELSPPVRDETTALTPVDMDAIRDSAADEISWLIADELDDELVEESGAEPISEPDDTLRDKDSPLKNEERGTDPASPIWEADPAPTNELYDDPDE
ncbi:MAG: hypothetical protein ACLFVJ_04765 [Persicimonas sp.]